MIATLDMSWSRRMRSPRFSNSAICEFSYARQRSFSSLRRGRRGRKVSAAAARKKLSLFIVNGGLGGRELAAHANDLSLDRQVARQRHRMIIDPHVDGRHAAADLADHGPVSAKVDQRGQDATMGEAT